ncbi:MAG: STAS/SEC14 domain-containing protein [bacterium]
MNKKRRKILIGNHTFFLGEDNILYITIVGEITNKQVDMTVETVTKLLGMVKKKVNVLVDINKAGKPSVKTRNLVPEFQNNKKVGKTAIFGLTPVAKVIASFAKGTAKNGDMRFCDTKELAIAWLKE